MLLKSICSRSLLIGLSIHHFNYFRVSAIHLTVTKSLELFESHGGFLISFFALKLFGQALNDFVEGFFAVF